MKLTEGEKKIIEAVRSLNDNGERISIQKGQRKPRPPAHERGDDEPPRIGHSGDAITLLGEMIEDCAVFLSRDAQQMYRPRLMALLDAITRGIV